MYLLEKSLKLNGENGSIYNFFRLAAETSRKRGLRKGLKKRFKKGLTISWVEHSK